MIKDFEKFASMLDMREKSDAGLSSVRLMSRAEEIVWRHLLLVQR
jgi:hypothetical protein